MKYQLKNPDEIIVLKGNRKYHSGNLTDEIAERLIRKNPNYLRIFKVVEEKKEVKAEKPKEVVIKKENKSKKSINKEENEGITIKS